MLDHYTQSGTDTDYAQQRNPMTRTWRTGNLYSSSGIGHGPGWYWNDQYQVSSSGTVTAVFLWQPSSPGDPPTTFIIGINSVASGISDPAGVGTYSLDDGFSDPQVPGGSGEVSQGTQYRIEQGNKTEVDVSVSPSARAFCPSAGGVNDSCTASVSVQAWVVSGSWDGPYYFHNGNYVQIGNDGNPDPTPWPNNTAGASPAITDTADGNHIFQLSSTTLECEVVGTITPVWFWNGPDLGIAPPSFTIVVTTKAFARDLNNHTQVEQKVDDAQGNTPQSSPPDSWSVADTTSSAQAQVQSDSYAPGQGNGYWALGPTLFLTGQVDDQLTDAPYNLFASVELDASLESNSPE